MVLPPALTRRLRSSSTWIGLGIIAPLGMLFVSGLMLLDLRKDAWEKAEQTSTNLLQVLERDIARNIEMYDLSLRAVVDNLRAPGFEQVSAELRQLILFDRAATAQDMGVLLVTDENGSVIFDASAVPPRKANYHDRAYFQAHKARADLGLDISKPLVSRLLGSRMIVLSRRINKPDGTFGGIVLGTLNLSYFTRLFDQIGLGQDGAINLYLRDGTRIMRQPYVEADIGTNIASAASFQGFVSRPKGSFVQVSARDGIERFYTFTRVGDLPLVLNVALSADAIEAEWRAKALVIGSLVLALCGLTIALSILFGRELDRRAAMQVELARLSRTDMLTNLANRRSFEDAFGQMWSGARRAGKPLSLLIVDADNFKRFNDRYGHAVGDEVLKGLALSLSESVRRPDDLVARVGGEEFAILLPDTDTSGASRIADRIHEGIATLGIPSAGIGAGAITVSIGLATGHASADDKMAALYNAADAALYVAKQQGRNQTRCDTTRVHTTVTAGPARRLEQHPSGLGHRDLLVGI